MSVISVQGFYFLAQEKSFVYYWWTEISGSRYRLSFLEIISQELLRKVLLLRRSSLLHLPLRPHCRSQCPHGLIRRSVASRLLRLWIRFPQGTWMFVCCECCVVSDRGLCEELITRPEESYWLWCVVVCDLETLCMRRLWPTGGCLAKNKQTNFYFCFTVIDSDVMHW